MRIGAEGGVVHGVLEHDTFGAVADIVQDRQRKSGHNFCRRSVAPCARCALRVTVRQKAKFAPLVQQKRAASGAGVDDDCLQHLDHHLVERIALGNRRSRPDERATVHRGGRQGARAAGPDCSPLPRQAKVGVPGLKCSAPPLATPVGMGAAGGCDMVDADAPCTAPEIEQARAFLRRVRAAPSFLVRDLRTFAIPFVLATFATGSSTQRGALFLNAAGAIRFLLI